MMQDVVIVNSRELDFEAVQRGRVNAIRRKRLPLETGVAGLTAEFSLSLVPAGYFTPRHRHNFDQIRYTLEGVQSTGHGDLGPGEIGYFPEGVHYGPQSQQAECATLVLQFQGASGRHLLSNDEMNATYERMRAAGAVFENGVYKGKTAAGKPKNKDSYVAIWEEHEGRALTFPAGRYRAPVMMIAANYAWIPDRERPGIETKHLGTFTELRTAIGFVRLRPGAALAAQRQRDAELRYCIDGSFSYGGREWAKDTYLYLPPGSAVGALAAPAGAAFFTIALPMIAEFAARQQHGAVAAE